MAHILYVYEDGIREPHKDRLAIANAIGEAVLGLCLKPQFLVGSNGQMKRKQSEHVGSHMNCINWVGEVHSRDVRVFHWYGNSLLGLERLNNEELEQARNLIQKELDRRKPTD